MIIVHTMCSCNRCLKLKQLLKQHNIEYEEVKDNLILKKEYPYSIYKGMEFTYEEIVKYITEGLIK